MVSVDDGKCPADNPCEEHGWSSSLNRGELVSVCQTLAGPPTRGFIPRSRDRRLLGGSGITVSGFGLGLATIGHQASRGEAFRQLDIALAAGVCLFDAGAASDTARGNRELAETVLGEWQEARGVRDRIVVTTRLTGVQADAARSAQALAASLRRLRCERIDLCQIDVGDPNQQSLTEVLDLMAGALAAGTIGAVSIAGSDNAPARALTDARDALGPAIVALNGDYSLVDRRLENRLPLLLAGKRLPLIVRAPLAGGVLTGKYLDDAAPIVGSRSADWARFVRTMLTPQRQTAVARYTALANDHGIGLTHLALAFAASRPFVASVLLTTSNAGQLASNLGAMRLTLAPELLDAIAAIHGESMASPG